MSSEQLADGVNPLDAELAATWDVLKGYSGRDTDLGIARRFGGAAAAYSLRDIGAMNGRVVKVRRDVDGDGTDKEEDFSANQVQDGTLEKWVNGELESTLPADVATAAAAYSLRKVKADYGAPTTKLDGSDGFPSNLNDLPLGNYTNAISGSTFTVGHFSTNFSAADSVSLSLGNNSFILRADKATSGAQYGHVIRVRGLSVGKRCTVTGEFRLIKGNGSGTVRMTVDISDETSETDEKSITTTNSTFTPFEVSALFNDSTADVNFIDFTLNDFGGPNSGSGPIEGEFRNIKIVESDNRVVRIRRSSDDVEVDVDFDTEGKLSANSLVGDIAEQGGESGSTTATTLGDFINGTDAFVHTWYDQAGSNNAVQETAANQPKIAEGGALLADGVTFDGTNDFLQTSTQVLTGTQTGANSMYAVIKQTSGDGGYICGSAGTGGTGARVGQSLYSSDTDKVILTDGQDATATGALDAITRIEGSNYLISVNYSNNNTDTLHSNSNANGYSNGSSAYAFSAGTKFTIGARDGSTAEAVLFDGSMKEIIAYDSDQSDNRFKIESNINNYYGLYNDANETNGDFDKTFSPTADGTFTPNGKDGFTLAVVSSTVYAGIKLNEDVASGDSIYVSFNCSFDAGSPSPKIVLRNTDSDFFGGGTLMSNEESVVNGFNSFTLTSTNSLASGVVLSEADDNLTYSISDFKVSRIARNGFVETWYDQSGNGNDATQGTAGNQPSIVLNGGINTDGLNFDGSDDVLVSTSFSATQPITTSAVFKSSNTSDSQTVIGGISSNYIIHRAGGAATAGLNAGTLLAPFSSITSKQLMTTLASGTSSTVAQNGVISSTGDAGTNNQTDLGIGSNGNGGTAGSGSAKFDGNIEEVIIFDADKTSDRTEIERDIANFYNITLS
jgi:hypothetical protein